MGGGPGSLGASHPQAAGLSFSLSSCFLFTLQPRRKILLNPANAWEGVRAARAPLGQGGWRVSSRVRHAGVRAQKHPRHQGCALPWLARAGLRCLTSHIAGVWGEGLICAWDSTEKGKLETPTWFPRGSVLSAFVPVDLVCTPSLE